MGAPSTDDAVLIARGKKPGEPHVITVNCPDRTGLACDICRIILDFGLAIRKGDVSTDGKWCYLLFWVTPHSGTFVRWPNLKGRLISACPSSCSVAFYLNEPPPPPSDSPVFLLKLFSLDRKGLLHDVTQVLCELELTIQRVKVTKTPDDRVLDLFFVTDNIDTLHTKERQDEICERLRAVLWESCTCEIQLAAQRYQCTQNTCTLSPDVSDALLQSEMTEKEVHLQALSSDLTKLRSSNVAMDNSLSPSHNLLQLHCVDHKGLLYDILRTLKDSDIQIAYARLSPNVNGYRDLDLFIQRKDGTKIVDQESRNQLCSRLKAEMLHPLRVTIVNRGPDAELLVANPVERSGKGRPRVFYDVTFALKTLGICIFSAEIGRYSTPDREWEVYRFLLEESSKIQQSMKETILDRVRRTLMGW